MTPKSRLYFLSARLLVKLGFRIVEHLTEADLTERYFADRRDGLRPGVPGRIVTAERQL